MANDITRRFFIGGLASAFAIGPRRIFAAAPGAFTDGRPALSFGLLSDVHIALATGGRSLRAAYSTATLAKAFEWFRDNGADAVVIAGDMAHCGLGGELKAISEAWFKVFPDDKAPDGRHVERVFVFGNHDWSSPGRAKGVFKDEAERKANLIVADPKKWWRECFREDWSPFQVRQVNGYDFMCAHWCNGGCHGKNERFTKGLKAWYDKRKGSFDPSKPFFHVQHPHPKGTVHGDSVWGQDDGAVCEALAAYPNAIAFSGHSHTSLTDERSIWQGAFTSVGCGSLRDVSLGVPGVSVGAPDGGENTKERKPGVVKMMEVPNRMNCRQGQLVRVYADHVVFSRREFVSGVQLGDDLVMPLPAAESRPFEFASRASKAKAPAFEAGAVLKVVRTKAVPRGGKKGDAADAWELTIPQANAEKTARAAVYEILAKGEDGTEKKFSMVNPGFRFPVGNALASGTTVFRVPCGRVPGEKPTFEVRAISCWGRRSEPISGAV